MADGYRVLAMAAGDASALSEADLGGLSQESAEAAVPLRLVGLAVMDNPLRPDTAETIHKLQLADLRCA